MYLLMCVVHYHRGIANIVEHFGPVTKIFYVKNNSLTLSLATLSNWNKLIEIAV